MCTSPLRRGTAAGSRSRWNRASRLTTAAAILEQAREVLDELGVKHARVAIHDEGALPFMIAARIEAAARRAGIALGKRSLPEQHPLPRAFAKRPAAPVAPVSAGLRTEVLHQCLAACARCRDSRPGRFRASRRERCGSHPGAKHFAGGRFRRRASAWCASTSCRSDWKIWRKWSARVRT